VEASSPPSPPLFPIKGWELPTDIRGWAAVTYGGQPLANSISFLFLLLFLRLVSSMFQKVKAEHFLTFCFSETHFNYLSDVALTNNTFQFLLFQKYF
jgi:hypothetical protein